MPIPAFVTGGILPTGIHECDLTEIEEIFVYNERRKKVWAGYMSYLKEMEAFPEVNVIYVDGSFITNKAEPKDVDIVVEFSTTAELLDVTSRVPDLFDRDAVKAAYDVDLLPTLEPIPPGVNDLREYFQYLRPEEAIDRGVSGWNEEGHFKN